VSLLVLAPFPLGYRGLCPRSVSGRRTFILNAAKPPMGPAVFISSPEPLVLGTAHSALATTHPAPPSSARSTTPDSGTQARVPGPQIWVGDWGFYHRLFMAIYGYFTLPIKHLHSFFVSNDSIDPLGPYRTSPTHQ